MQWVNFNYSLIFWYLSPMLLMYLVLYDNESMWVLFTWVWFLASPGLKIFSTAMMFCCLYYSDACEYKQLMVQCHQILFKFGILINNTCNFNSVVIVYSPPANTQIYYGDETNKWTFVIYPLYCTSLTMAKSVAKTCRRRTMYIM